MMGRAGGGLMGGRLDLKLLVGGPVIPALAIRNASGGYVRNASGGYVMRSFT